MMDDVFTGEAGEAGGDGPAHRAHADNAHHSALKPRAEEDGPPAGKAATTHQRIAGADMPAEADHDAQREFCGGCGQQVRHHGHRHIAGAAGGEVEIIRPLQGAADGAQIRAMGEEFGVHMVGHEGQKAIGAGGAAEEFGPRPGGLGGVGVDAGKACQHRQRVGVGLVGHHDQRPVLFHPAVIHLSSRSGYPTSGDATEPPFGS